MIAKQADLVHKKQEMTVIRIEMGCARRSISFRPCRETEPAAGSGGLTFNTQGADLVEMGVVDVGVDPEQAPEDRLGRVHKGGGETNT